MLVSEPFYVSIKRLYNYAHKKQILIEFFARIAVWLHLVLPNTVRKSCLLFKSKCSEWLSTDKQIARYKFHPSPCHVGLLEGCAVISMTCCSRYKTLFTAVFFAKLLLLSVGTCCGKKLKLLCCLSHFSSRYKTTKQNKDAFSYYGSFNKSTDLLICIACRWKKKSVLVCVKGSLHCLITYRTYRLLLRLSL